MILKSPQEEEAVRRMQKIYFDAERKIVAEITRKRSLGYVGYAEVASLERVQAILTKMQDDTFTYAPIMVETIFHGQGEKNAAGYANARALTATQTAVVQTLVNNLLGEVLEVSETAYNSAREYLTVGRLEGQTLRSAALEAVASQEAIGASWTMAQKQMTAELMGKGITGFVDKAGRKWSLTDYCNMAVRTTAKQAAVASILTEDDYDLWQIVKIGTTCPVCAVYEGRVYSKSGTNPDYPPLASAFGKIDPEGANNLENTYLNIHPSCLHSLIRYTTIGKSEKQIQKDKDFSSFEKNPITHDPRTKKQREAYQKKMRDRQKLVNDTHQWKRYKAVLGNECPGWDDFIKHKRADDDVYKGLESKFRSFGIKASYNDKKIDRIAALDEYKRNEDAIKATLQGVESKSRSLTYETATIIDRKGAIISRSSGESHSVEIPGKLARLNVVTHNHPAGRCFSPQDIDTLIANDILELRASTPGNTIYSIMQTASAKRDRRFMDAFCSATDGKKAAALANKWRKEGKPMTSPKEMIDDAADHLAIEFLEKHAADYGYIFRRV